MIEPCGRYVVKVKFAFFQGDLREVQEEKEKVVNEGIGHRHATRLKEARHYYLTRRYWSRHVHDKEIRVMISQLPSPLYCPHEIREILR